MTAPTSSSGPGSTLGVAAPEERRPNTHATRGTPNPHGRKSRLCRRPRRYRRDRRKSGKPSSANIDRRGPTWSRGRSPTPPALLSRGSDCSAPRGDTSSRMQHLSRPFGHRQVVRRRTFDRRHDCDYSQQSAIRARNGIPGSRTVVRDRILRPVDENDQYRSIRIVIGNAKILICILLDQFIACHPSSPPATQPRDRTTPPRGPTADPRQIGGGPTADPRQTGGGPMADPRQTGGGPGETGGR